MKLPPSRRVSGITSSCSAATNGSSGPRCCFNAGQVPARLLPPGSRRGFQLPREELFQPISGAISRRPAERPERCLHTRWRLTVSTLQWAEGAGPGPLVWTCRRTAQTSARLGSRGDTGRIRSTKGAFEPVGLFLFTRQKDVFSCIRSRAQATTVPPLAVCNRNTVTTSGQ